MRSIAIVFAAAFLAASACAGQPHPDQAGLVQEATAVCIQALQFAQGDKASLLDARDHFTPEGWDQFMEKLRGWQDDGGAATYTSSFVPSGPALDVRWHDGVVDLTIPGVLEQESRNAYGGVSTTRYRAEVELQFAEGTHKVTHLKQRTCGGAGSHLSCR